MIGSLISLLIYLIVVGLIIGLVVYLARAFLPAPFGRYVEIAAYVIGVLILILLLLSLVDAGGSRTLRLP